jgi:hypothetical protein
MVIGLVAYWGRYDQNTEKTRKGVGAELDTVMLGLIPCRWDIPYVFRCWTQQVNGPVFFPEVLQPNPLF